MTDVKLTYKQEELIRNFAQISGFKNFGIDANIGTFKGDNYLGVITTVTVKEKGNGRTANLILKTAHLSENFRKEVPIAEAFIREVYIYNEILPRFFNFQVEKCISDPFTGAAKYYGSCLENANESILMNDIKKNGYKLWNRKIPMNDEHVTLVFSEYARFHAISLAFREYHSTEFNQLTQKIQNNIFEAKQPNPEEFECYINTYFATGLKGVEGNIKATTALEKFRKNVFTLMSELNDIEDKNKVVIHGDCWCNNMLFRYENNGTIPTKVCLIDWQISKVGSPVLDLAYFYSVCSAKNVIEQLPKYLQIYHKILATNLTEFGCDPEKVFSFDTLMNQWKKYSWYGVFMALMTLKLMLSDSEEAPDISETVDKGNTLLDALDFEVSNTSEYKIRLGDLVEYMADNSNI